MVSSSVPDSGLCCVFISTLFSVALCHIYSVRGSFFLHWPFFVYAVASSVSGCFKVLLLRSVTRSDLRVSLSDEVARWDKSLLFLFAPSSSTPVVLLGFSRMFPVFPRCLCIRNFLSSFPFLPGFVLSSLLVGVVPFLFSAFFFSFDLPYLFVAFTFPVLSCSSASSIGYFVVSFLGLGFLPSGYLFPRPSVSQRLVSSGVVLPFLVLDFFLWAPSSLLCGLTVLLVSALGLSFSSSFLVPLSLFIFYLSFRLVFLVLSWGFSPCFGWVSSPLVLPFCCAAATSSSAHSLSPFGFVPSMLCGNVSPVFLPTSELWFYFSLTLAVSFRSCSLFVCPHSPVRSFSQSSFLFLSLRDLSFPCPGFPFVSCCCSAFCLPVARFNVPLPLFLVIGLVLFFFYCLVRFPSLSAGGESLARGGGGGGPLTLHRFV